MEAPGSPTQPSSLPATSPFAALSQDETNRRDEHRNQFDDEAPATTASCATLQTSLSDDLWALSIQPAMNFGNLLFDTNTQLLEASPRSIAIEGLRTEYPAQSIQLA